jgi:hypothetical protein
MPNVKKRRPTTAVNPDAPTRKRIQFDIVKGNFFRGIHADGVWGGATPQGLIAMTFYSERFAIPQQVTHTVGHDGILGPELVEERVSRNAVVRDAEVCVYMTPRVAESFKVFLDTHLERLKSAQESARKKGKKGTK